MAHPATPWGLHVLSPRDLDLQKETNVDIIAVHGLNGHPFDTWTYNGKNGRATNWLRDILPSRIENARIMTFGYDARFFGASTSDDLDDARDLLQRITGRRSDPSFRTNPIIFIAHSLGGLVVKQALIMARNNPNQSSILDCTKGVMFFGTPHRGSAIANYAIILARMFEAFSGSERRLQNLQPRAQILEQLTESFRWIAPSIQIVSFYETERLPATNSIIVERDSATLGIVHEDVIPLRANHRSMCHIPSPEDENVGGIVLPRLEELVQQVLFPSLNPNPLAFSTSISGQHPLHVATNGASAAPNTETHFVVPVAPNALFTGRQKILNQMRSKLRGHSTVQRRIVLTGLGGIGKTQIATALVYDFFAKRDATIVFWTFADSREKLIKSFTDIAKHLGLYNSVMHSTTGDNTNTDGDATASQRHVDAVKRWLASQENSDWILVFDNADDLESFDISEFFPNHTSGNIIITSRRQQAARFGDQIEVDIMDDTDALNMLLRCSRLSQNVYLDPARRLATTLGNLPLALDQAGAYIAEQGIDFDDYARLFSINHAAVLRHKPPRATWSYEHTVFTTWEISYAAVKENSPAATRFLDIAAFFGSDDIPLSLVVTLARRLGGEVTPFLRSFLDSVLDGGDYDTIIGPVPVSLLCDQLELPLVIGKLLSYSLIKRKTDTRSYSMHPLVHTWLRDRQQDRGELCDTARLAIALVHRAIFNATDLSRFADVEALYSHAFICNSQFESLPELFSLVDAPRLAACIIAVDAWVPLSMDEGTMLKTDRFFNLVRAKSATSLWNIPPALITLRTAYRLSSQQERDRSSALCEQYFATVRPSNRYEEMYRACMAQMYGPSLFRRGLYERAKAIFAQSDTSCDPSNYMLARKQLVLAGIAIDQDELTTAEQYCMSCRDILQVMVGPDFFIWNVWHQLTALCYIAQQRYKAAEDLLTSRIADKMSSVATGRFILTFSDYELFEVFSRSLCKQGRHDEALGLLKKLLDSSKSSAKVPARALGELSFQTTLLDKMTVNTGLAVDTADFELHINEAQSLFEQAQQAYSYEWTRGTWAFKFHDKTLAEFRRKATQSLAMPTQSENNVRGFLRNTTTLPLFSSSTQPTMDGDKKEIGPGPSGTWETGTTEPGQLAIRRKRDGKRRKIFTRFTSIFSKQGG